MSNILSLDGKLRTNTIAAMPIQKLSSAVEHDTTLNENYTQKLGVLASPDFFEPIEAPLIAQYEGAEIVVPNKKAIVRADTGALVSVVGKDYQVVKNAEVFAQFDEALAQSGINLEGAYKTVNECRGGASTILGYSFPAYETTITDREVGDTVRLSIRARNSYDGFNMFETNFFEERLVCANSMVSSDCVSYFAGKHTKNLVIEHAVEKILESITVFCEHGETYKRWAETKLSDKGAEDIFKKFCIKNGYKTEYNEKKVNEFMGQWNIEAGKLGKNVWALYNTLTFWATHAKVQERAKENKKERQVAREVKLKKFMPQIDQAFAAQLINGANRPQLKPKKEIEMYRLKIVLNNLEAAREMLDGLADDQWEHTVSLDDQMTELFDGDLDEQCDEYMKLDETKELSDDASSRMRAVCNELEAAIAKLAL